MAARVAVFQANGGIDPARNAEALTRAIAQAAADGAIAIFTPEMSGLLDREGWRADGQLRGEDEDFVLALVREAAARHGMWVQLGSLAIRRADGRLANRAFVIDGTGTIRARYDKLHLFDVSLPSGESWRESARYVPGEEAVLADTPVGKLGLAICYDLRFPALFAALAEAGAELFAVPSAFTVPTGQAHWHVLLRARAIEAGAFVIAAAQTGRHEDGRETFGHSLVVDPWGEVLLDMGADPGLGFADVDLARLRDVRARLPALAHRRAIDSVARAQ